jgi:hypothetical protein
MSNNIENPKRDEQVCFNCTHLLWLIGIGQGLRCGITKKQIPSRWHSCKKFNTKWPVNIIKPDSEENKND